MPQDYKNNSNTRRKRKEEKTPQRFPASVGFVAGLGLGLFVAFLVYISLKSPMVQDCPACEETPCVAESETETLNEAPPAPHPDAQKPRFEFYTILPEQEVIIPENELESETPEGRDNESSKPVTKVDSREYVLQAGSFREHKDADRMRAKLALLGVEATIQPVTIKQGERWYRVRIGPFDTVKELNKTRNLLNMNDMKVILVRQK